MISIGPELGQHLMRPWKIRSVLAPDGQYPAGSRYRCRTTPQRNLLVELKCRSRGSILEREATLIVRGLCAHLLRIKFEPALLAEGGRLTDDMRGEIFHLFRFLRFEPDRDHVAGGFLSLYVKAL